MNTKHTPGPWRQKILDRNYRDICTPEGDTVAIVERYMDSEGNERKWANANARLIAAAPALLEALTKLTNIVECLAVNDAQVKMFDWDNVVSEARASLSAAKPSSLKGESSDGR